jgi:HEAT repeats
VFIVNGLYEGGIVMKLLLVLSVVAIVSLVLTVPVHADRIILKDGSVLSGTIVDPDANPVVIKIPGGKVRIDRDSFSDLLLEEETALVEESREALEIQSYEETDEKSGNVLELDGEVVIRFNAYMDKIVPSEHADEDMSMTPERQHDFNQVVEMGPTVTPLLANKLAKKSGNGQVVALRAIEAIDGKKGEKLARSLAGKHANAEVREESLRILARSRSEKNAAVFESALKDTQGNVRAAAVESLGKSKDPKQVPNLVAALGDPVPSVRNAAEKALAKVVPDQKFKTEKEWRKWAEKKFKSVPNSYQEPVNTSTKLTFGES